MGGLDGIGTTTETTIDAVVKAIRAGELNPTAQLPPLTGQPLIRKQHTTVRAFGAINALYKADNATLIFTGRSCVPLEMYTATLGAATAELEELETTLLSEGSIFNRTGPEWNFIDRLRNILNRRWENYYGSQRDDDKEYLLE